MWSTEWQRSLEMASDTSQLFSLSRDTKFSRSFGLYVVGIYLSSGTLLDPGEAVVKEKTVPILTEIRVQQWWQALNHYTYSNKLNDFKCTECSGEVQGALGVCGGVSIGGSFPSHPMVRQDTKCNALEEFNHGRSSWEIKDNVRIGLTWWDPIPTRYPWHSPKVALESLLVQSD